MNDTTAVVTIPLSEYNLLLQQRDAIARHDLTVGRYYETEQDGEKTSWLCRSFAVDTFYFVSNYQHKLKYLTIKLQK